MTDRYDEPRIAGELRRAAEQFDPDPDRIRQLMQAQAGAEPVPVASPDRRGVHGRWWAWSAAAASVVVAVFGADAALQRWNEPTAPGHSVQAGIATSAATHPTTSTGPTTSTHATSSTHPTTRASTSPRSTAPPSGGTRAVTVTVTGARPGAAYRLGESAGEQWLLAPPAVTAASPRSPGPGWPLGPIQTMGNGSSVEPGPFTVSWRNGTAAAGTSTTWLTAPQSVRGVPAGLRVPVRFGSRPATVTVLAGTTGGAGRLTVTLPGVRGGQLTVPLPACGDRVCPSVVRITLQRAAGQPAAGDLILDLAATAPGDRLGIAAVSLT